MIQISCPEDYRPGRTVRDAEAVAERVSHIIDTPPGSLPQDPEWGWAIRNLIGVGLEEGDLDTAAALGREAFRRDPEVLDADVLISKLSEGVYNISVGLSTTFGAVTLQRQIP